MNLYPGVPDALRKLKEAGFRTFIVTNQSGIGRGLITEAQYRAVHRRVPAPDRRRLDRCLLLLPGRARAPLLRRKPEPGMVLEAAADIRTRPGQFVLRGRQGPDIECGRRAGTRTILVLTGYGAAEPCCADFTAGDVVEAVEIAIQRRVRPGALLP